MSGDEDLKAEWARAAKGGRAASRQKAVATVASIAATLPVLLLGYVCFFIVWPFDRTPVVLLALPWAPALASGWWVQRKMWPRGALGR